MKSFLDLLPVEIVDNIVEFLPTRDANSFAQTCRAAYWRADPYVWKDNVPTSTKPGPITWGIVTKQLKVVKKAVEAGADINAPDWLSCFHIPERCDNNPDEWSLAKAASKDANSSPLHFAALTNNLEAAEYLLQKGATLHNTGLANWALNMCSCHWVDKPWYWAGEDEDEDEDEDNVKWEGKHYEDYLALPLHTAVCHGSLEVAKLFLQHGASVHLHGIRRHLAEADAKQNHPIESRDDLLHVLVWKGPDYLASIDLLAQSPDTDINAIEGTWPTPLQIACLRPHNAVVIAKLAEFGAIETSDGSAQHLLLLVHGCIHTGRYDNALALLKACLHASDSKVGSDIREDAALIFTDAVAFHARLEEHHVKQVKQIIRMLVQDYGLKLNAPFFYRPGNKATPLEYLVGGNCPMPEHLIQLLVDLGARLDIRNGKGHNPLVRCLWMEQPATKATKTKSPKKAWNKGIRERAEAGSSGSSIIRPQTIRALIESCRWANIRLDEKYTWGKEELTLGRILEIRFPGWKPPEGLRNNRALWEDLVRHLENSSELGFD